MLKQRNLLIGLVVIYFIRLLLTQLMGLMPQDAYYYFYSEDMALSYFDHPPMVAYMLRLFTTVFGKSVGVVKLTNFLLTIATVYGFYYLSQLLLSKTQAVKTTLFYGSTLLVTVLSINTTPDVPLLFFWTLTLIVLYHAFFEDKFWCWPLAGLLIGLSFDSKYTALFLLLGVLVFLLLSENHRRYLFSKELLLLGLCFLIGIAPVLIWNMQNDWMSFRFQSAERASSIMAFQFQPQFFFGNLGLQAALLLPPLFIGVLYVFYCQVRKTIRSWRWPTAKMLFLISFSLPLLGFFLAVSLLYWVKLNWMMPAYVALLIWLVPYLKNRLLAYQLGLALFFHILLFIQIVFYPVDIKSDDTWYGWEELADQVHILQQQYPDYFVFSNDGYKTSAVLNFYLEEPVYAGNVIGKPAFQFGVKYPDLNFLAGQHAIYLDSDKAMLPSCENEHVANELSLYFAHVELMDPIFIKDASGKPRRKFCVYRCDVYQGKAKGQ
jgi:hypothetical protein